MRVAGGCVEILETRNDGWILRTWCFHASLYCLLQVLHLCTILGFLHGGGQEKNGSISFTFLHLHFRFLGLWNWDKATYRNGVLIFFAGFQAGPGFTTKEFCSLGFWHVVFLGVLLELYPSV